MEKMQEQTMRTLGLAIAGFAVLLVAAPDWARGGLLVFAGIYAVMVYVLDANVRNWIPDHRRSSGVRDDTSRRSGDDARRAGVKSPAARRAAT